MRTGGWKGDPVDIVRMPDGRLTSMDNTRILAARETGTEVLGNVRAFDSRLTAQEITRFTREGQVPSTWGEAINIRIQGQTGGFPSRNPSGADTLPKLIGRPK
jgi:hypothetical protein